MTRPLPIAASIALALLSLAVFAQAPPPAEAIAPATAAAPDAVAPVAPVPLATPASAPAAAPAAIVGSTARGKSLAYTCQGCHGIPGYKNAYPNYHVPRIGGQAPEYLSAALHEYRKGSRKHPTMQAQAESFSEQDIADIAAYLSTLKQ